MSGTGRFAPGTSRRITRFPESRPFSSIRRSRKASSAREDLDAKHEKRREQRIEAIKRWVEYIEENPPEVWGPQQNALINSQLEAARKSGISAEQYL